MKVKHQNKRETVISPTVGQKIIDILTTKGTTSAEAVTLLYFIKLLILILSVYVFNGLRLLCFLLLLSLAKKLGLRDLRASWFALVVVAACLFFLLADAAFKTCFKGWLFFLQLNETLDETCITT